MSANPPSITRRQRLLVIGSVAGILVYALALVVVLYQGASACALNAPIAGDQEYEGYVRWVPATYMCRWEDLPGEPAIASTDTLVAVVSVVGLALFIICLALLIHLKRTTRKGS